jgi:hypothetical protein
MGNYNVIYRGDEALEILKEISVHMFQNKDGSVNQQVLGLYVHELDGNRVLQRENKLLICKTIEDAQYEELG